MVDDGRRYVPEEGLQKLRNKIHKESKAADSKNLPYTFSKPIRKSFTWFECVKCGRVFNATKNTCMVVCPVCKKLTKVRELNGVMACLDSGI